MERISAARLATLKAKCADQQGWTTIPVGELTELLRAYRTPTGLDREAVARLVSPSALREPKVTLSRSAALSRQNAQDAAYQIADRIIALGVVASPPEPEAKTGGAEAWPHSDWKCPGCLCRSYSHFDEPDGHGGFRKSGNIRCHGCKREWYAPISLIPVEPTGEGMAQSIEDSRVQLIAQAREAHAKAMDSFGLLASESAWTASEQALSPPPNNYWTVIATRTPTAHDAEPYTVSKALTRDPNVASLLTFISTALPQLCDLAENRLVVTTTVNVRAVLQEVLDNYDADVSDREDAGEVSDPWADTVEIPVVTARTMLTAAPTSPHPASVGEGGQRLRELLDSAEPKTNVSVRYLNRLGGRGHETFTVTELRAEVVWLALSASPASPPAGVGEDIRRLAVVVRGCAAQFREYERLHLAKSPPDTEKATRNAEWADNCELALALSPVQAEG